MPEKEQNANSNKTNSRRSEPVKPENEASTLANEDGFSLADSLQLATFDPGRLNPGDILAMQRSVGNRAVSGLLIQRKLTVGAANDSYEQEADHTADQVMRMPDSVVRREVVPEEEEPTGLPVLQREAISEEEEEPAGLPGLQRESAPEEEEPAGLPSIQLKVSHPPVDAMGSFDVGSRLEKQIQSHQGAGAPLPGDVRDFMEPRFGADFNGVRLHMGSESAQMNREVSARAFTTGHDIFLGEGSPDLASSEGRHLLAHELTHVVQQEGAPAAIQGKRSAGVLMAGEAIPGKSVALGLRDILRAKSLSKPMIRRAVKTWGGEFKTDKYQEVKDPGLDGVEIEIRFKPNKNVNAELIGTTQAVRSSEKGTPFAIGTGAQKAALESRMVPTGKTGAGTRIDQYASSGNPLYAAGAPNPGDTLATTPTEAFAGQHGWHYIDKAGKLQEKDALLKDRPQLSSTRKESSQVFETTALAVKGVQEGTFYGSVQWGWEKDAAGKVKVLPFKAISSDVPSSAFAGASEQWNKSKTSGGDNTIDLPIVTGKYTTTPGTWLVSNPSNYKTSLIDNLAKNTRLEVTNKGTKQPFNKAGGKWWKVTVVEGPHIGKVGWVMQDLLSDDKSK